MHISCVTLYNMPVSYHEVLGPMHNIQAGQSWSVRCQQLDSHGLSDVTNC
jgi:hypothetical protein